MDNPLFNSFRRIVSKDKHRFQFDNYDLDLSYITDRVIAMCQPGESFQKMFMNDIDKLAQFFKMYHKDHYMIYNLSETTYDYKKFDYRVKSFGFTDHHNPTLSSLIRIVVDIDTFLKADNSNVVAIHCRAGRGRTGTVISSYLLFSKYLINFLEEEQVFAALTLFAKRRSHNNLGVRVPSQIRYVQYFYQYLRTCPLLPPPPAPVATLYLEKILFLDLPRLEKNKWGGNFNPVIKISKLSDRPPFGVIYTHHPPQESIRLLERKAAVLIQQKEPTVADLKEMILDVGGIKLEGDIVVQVFHRTTSRMAYAELVKTFVNATDVMLSFNEKYPQTPEYPLVPLFRFSFHTSFVEVEKGFNLRRDQCDANYSGHLSSPFPHSFALTLFFMGTTFLPSSPSSRLILGPPPPLPSKMGVNSRIASDTCSDGLSISARSQGPPPGFWDEEENNDH